MVSREEFFHFNRSPGFVPISPKELALVSRYVSPFQWEYQGWNPIARIDVVSLQARPAGAPHSLAYKLVFQDGGAPSTIFHLPDRASTEWLTQRTIFGVPYWLKDSPKVLVIGIGGGPDVQAGLASGARRIIGVEVNEKMVEITRSVYTDFSGNPYSDARVQILVGDGRNTIHHSTETFDIIQLTGVDTTVASPGANPNLAENYLYTVEAMVEYYRHLAPDGLLSVSFPNVQGLGVRLVAAVDEALIRLGVERPMEHLFVSQISGYIHVLVKNGPFHPQEIELLTTKLAEPISSFYLPLYHSLWGDPSEDFRMENQIMLAQGKPAEGEFAGYLAAREQNRLADFFTNYTRNIQPSSDENPFFSAIRPSQSRSP